MTRELPSNIGPYRIVRKLGEGGMGVVYEAVNDAIERRVAIKCLNAQYAADEEATRRFFNEARAANRINHPSIVQISDYSAGDGGNPYIVMEFLDGNTLASLLHRSPALLSLNRVLAIAWQIATALAAAHEKNIVHRDIKPENIMLVGDPGAPGRQRVKILDFGVAKLASSNASKTGASVIMGTPRYMSPEQCKGSGQVDDRADCYSLGVMLFEMLSGRLPFAGEGAGELIAQHMYKEPPPLHDAAPDCPAAAAALVARLLRKMPADRPGMAEVAAILERLLSETSAVSSQIAGTAETAASAGSVAEEESVLRTRSSTLRGEVTPHGRGPFWIGTLAGLGLLLLVGAGALWRGIVATHPQRATRPESSGHGVRSASPESVPNVAAGNPQKITWTVHSIPSGAAVIDAAGISVGQTPYVQQQESKAGEQTLTLRLQGFQDRVLLLRSDQDHTVTENMKPVSKKTSRAKKERKQDEHTRPSPSTRRTSYED